MHLLNRVIKKGLSFKYPKYYLNDHKRLKKYVCCLTMWMKKLSPLWLCLLASDWCCSLLFPGQSIYFRFLNFWTEVCMSWRLGIYIFWRKKIVKWSPHVLLIECSMFTPNQSINILLLNIALCTKFIFLNRYILCNFEYQVDWFFEKKFFAEEGAI